MKNDNKFQTELEATSDSRGWQSLQGQQKIMWPLLEEILAT